MDFIAWKESDDEDAEKMYSTEDVESLLQYNGYDAYVTRVIYEKMLKEMHHADQDHA